MTLVIREAGAADYDAVAELTVAAYRTIDPDLGTYETRMRDVAGRARVATVLVAEADGRVVGTATYVPDGASPLAESDDPNDAAIRLLAVAPDAMGRGIGTALVAECISRARRAGRRRLVLLTRESMHAAHRIYQRLEFRREPGLDEVSPNARLLAYSLDLRNS